MKARTAQFLVRRSTGRVEPDVAIVEEPLEIRLDSHVVTTTMRTPGNDFELAVGFLHSEGLLGGAGVRRVRYCAVGSPVDSDFNVVDVDTGGTAPEPTARLGWVTASCGLCGNASIEELAARLDPFPHAAPLDLPVIASIPDAVREAQVLFSSTGAVHAAATFDIATGELDLVREDIGRHNAVDKVVGRLRLDDRLPAPATGLFVSGRASFEIVQKAWAAGFAVVAAVSGPSSLAVETARRANVGLIGFLRGGSMNVYSPAPL